MALLASSLQVGFVSENPEVDPLIQWLMDIKFWNSRVKYRIRQESSLMPGDMIKTFQKVCNLPFDYNTNKLLIKLLSCSTGIWLSQLGIYSDEWIDPNCSVGRICALQLGYISDHVIIRPTKIAYDPRVQSLIGIPTIHAS